VLTVAHRISTIIDYDMIIVMEKGEIIEMGEPGTGVDRRCSLWDGQQGDLARSSHHPKPKCAVDAARHAPEHGERIVLSPLADRPRGYIVDRRQDRRSDSTYHPRVLGSTRGWYVESLRLSWRRSTM
jgi:energy-coupling factor transporter ATP-binding protein EcfA2